MYKIALLLAILSTSAIADDSCLKSIGKKDAETLVSWCSKVSTSTHPPCNVKNSCELITYEIKRGCKFIIDDYNNKFLDNQQKPPFYCLITGDLNPL